MVTMSTTEILLAVFFALVVGVLVGVAIEHVKAAAMRPYLEQAERSLEQAGRIRAAALASLRRKRSTLYMTRLTFESGETVGVRPGWTPGLNAGDIITNLGKSYAVVDVRDPAFDFEPDQNEATLILRPISASAHE